jgi:hypothetical protein
MLFLRVFKSYPPEKESGKGRIKVVDESSLFPVYSKREG